MPKKGYIMKKYFSIIVCALIVLGCFSACGTKTEGGEVVTDFAQQNIAVVTEEDGGAKRDGNGNLIVLVTDDSGKNIKNENGEYATEAVTLNHVVVIGETAETKYYSITMPEGWTYNTTSFNTLKFDNDKGDKIVINSKENSSASKLLEELKLLDAVDSAYPDCKKVNSSVTLNGESCPFVARYVEKDASGEPSYLGFIFFEHGSVGFSCMITGNRDVTPDIDAVEKVLNTIQFK